MTNRIEIGSGAFQGSECGVNGMIGTGAREERFVVRRRCVVGTDGSCRGNGCGKENGSIRLVIQGLKGLIVHQGMVLRLFYQVTNVWILINAIKGVPIGLVVNIPGIMKHFVGILLVLCRRRCRSNSR